MGNPSITQPLTGQTILVTRPTEQAGKLAALIEKAGGLAMRLPMIAILPVQNDALLKNAAKQLNTFDVAVFVSPNAIAQSLPYLLAQGVWPKHLQAVVMGEISAKPLAAQGVKEIVFPRAGHDSEAVLEMPLFEEQAIRGKRVLILRGEEGRELLGDTLVARGAEVARVPCYRRVRPDHTEQERAALVAALDSGALSAVTVTSTEILNNLFAEFGADKDSAKAVARLRELPCFVPHRRIASAAEKMGCACVVQCAPGDEGLISGMREWFKSFSADRNTEYNTKAEQDGSAKNE